VYRMLCHGRDGCERPPTCLDGCRMTIGHCLAGTQRPARCSVEALRRLSDFSWPLAMGSASRGQATDRVRADPEHDNMR
jgi:hypothetical protein